MNWVSKWTQVRGSQFVMLGEFSLDLEIRAETDVTGISYERM